MTDNCKECWGNKYYMGKECRACLGTGNKKESTTRTIKERN